MKTIKEYIQSQKEKTRIEKESNIAAGFMVVEHDGRLWLTHDGIAFLEFSKETKAENIAEEIDKARKTAIKFNRL